MKSERKHGMARCFGVVVVVAMVCPLMLRAEIITGVTAKASSETTGFNRYAKWAVNGVGMIDENTHTNGANGVTWQASSTNEWFLIYLNRECYVEKIRVWNYNESVNWAVRGVRVADILTSSGAGWEMLEEDYVFTKAPGTSTYNTPDEITVNRTALHIRINAKECFSGGNKVGLSEVQIVGTPVGTRWISNVTATAYSQDITYDRWAVNAVNGSGLTGQTHTWSENNNMWLSGSGTQGWYQVNLGAPYTLRRIDVWNYDNASWTDRGTRRANIHTSMSDPGSVHPGEGAPWVEVVANQYFSKAPGGSVVYDTPMRLLMNQRARYVGFEIFEAHNGNRIGFSELQFHAAPPRGTVISVQ